MNDSPHTEPISFDLRPDGFSEKLFSVSEEIESLTDNPPKQAAWAIRRALWAVRQIRGNLTLFDEKIGLVEFHLESWSSKLRDARNNIETAKSNTILPAHSPSGLLTPAETARKLGISRSSLASLTRDERFPQPIQVSPRKTAYIALDIENWIYGSSN